MTDSPNKRRDLRAAAREALEDAADAPELAYYGNGPATWLRERAAAL